LNNPAQLFLSLKGLGMKVADKEIDETWKWVPTLSKFLVLI